MAKKIGRQTVLLKKNIAIASTSSVVGPYEMRDRWVSILISV